MYFQISGVCGEVNFWWIKRFYPDCPIVPYEDKIKKTTVKKGIHVIGLNTCTCTCTLDFASGDHVALW